MSHTQNYSNFIINPIIDSVTEVIGLELFLLIPYILINGSKILKNSHQFIRLEITELRYVYLFYLQRLKQDGSRTRFMSSGMQGVVEHGALFHRTPESSTDQKKVSSVLKYWVIGYVLKPDKYEN